MKTTIDIASNLFREARSLAGKRKATFREIVEAALRLYLSEHRKPHRPFRLRQHPFHGEGLAEGLQEGDWSAIRGRIYEGRGG